MTCSVCNQLIRKNDKVVVISYPIKILNDNGDYDLLGDFRVKQKLYHFQCFCGYQNNKDSFYKEDYNIPTGIINKVYESLTLLKEKVNRSTIEELYFTYPFADVNELIKLYFKNK